MATPKTRKSYRWMIPALITALAAAAVIVSAYLFSPSSYVGIDVNPSIEIHTNRLGRVTSVEAANADAAQLLDGYRVTDNQLDDVVEDLVDRMIVKGYITADGPNDVLISVGNDSVSQDTLARVNERIATYLSARRMEVNLLQQNVSVDKNLQNSAAQNGVSAGRMALIEKIMAGGDLTREELAQMTVADLLEYAYTNGIPLDIIEDRLDELEERYGEDPALETLEDQLDNAADAPADAPYDDADDLLDGLDDDWTAPVPRQPQPGQSAGGQRHAPDDDWDDGPDDDRDDGPDDPDDDWDDGPDDDRDDD